MSPRPIAFRTRGHRGGPITRLVSPGDVGRLIKPFVFLDLFQMPKRFVGSMPIHPHSGIATVTVLTEGDLTFAGPAAGCGTLGYGGVEWMRASGGVWHGDELTRGESERIVGFQLWVALPPETENAEVDRQYLDASHTPSAGPARVILGTYQGQTSPVRATPGLTYLLVTLADGESWTFQPPPGQTVGWVAVSHGALEAADSTVPAGELVVFAPGEEAVTFVARGEVRFVVASAVPHPYPLVTGSYSVHTNAAALVSGERRIVELAPGVLKAS